MGEQVILWQGFRVSGFRWFEVSSGSFRRFPDSEVSTTVARHSPRRDWSRVCRLKRRLLRVCWRLQQLCPVSERIAAFIRATTSRRRNELLGHGRPCAPGQGSAAGLPKAWGIGLAVMRGERASCGLCARAWLGVGGSGERMMVSDARKPPDFRRRLVVWNWLRE